MLTSGVLLLAVHLIITGFHDAPNAVAVAVRSRALTTMRAVSVSAFFNLVGVLLAGFVLANYSQGWINVPSTSAGLAMLIATLISVILWGLLTWFLRMPSSSTHAIIGGLFGASWAASAVNLHHQDVFHQSFWTLVFLPLLLAPALVFVASWALVFPGYAIARRSYPRAVNSLSRYALSLSNSAISLGHGIQTGQKATILLLLMFTAANYELTPSVLALSFIITGIVLAFGTVLGGWRIGRTISTRMVRIDPFRGAIAQLTTASVMLFGGLALNAPVSSSHVAASSVVGAGVNQRFNALRLPIISHVLITWAATIPATFCLSAIIMLALSPLV
nr:inorganic phosphate transporter [Rothia sp. ZJ1223]